MIKIGYLPRLLFIVSITLFSSSTSFALPYSTSQLTIDWSSLLIETSNGLSLGQGSSSTDIVAESFNDPQYDYDFDISNDLSSNLFANTVVGGAISNAYANSREISYSSQATGPINWSQGDAYGWRYLEFTSNGSGTITVSLDFEYYLAVETTDFNEFALAWADVWLDIDNLSTNSTEEDHSGLELFVFDSDQAERNINGTLSVSMDFEDGQFGQIWVEAETLAYQESIPAPTPLWLIIPGLLSLYLQQRRA